MSDIIVDDIKRAIAEKKPVKLLYKNKIRNGFPTMFGRTKDNRLVLHAFQYWAEDDQKSEGWRFFYLDEIAVLAVIEQPEVRLGNLSKSDGEYKPPAFVVEVLAIVKP